MQSLSLVVLLSLRSATSLVITPLARPGVTAARVVVSMGIEETAQSCIEEGCPIDMVEELIEELKADVSHKDIVSQLQALIASPQANKSEIEKLVAAAGRSFSVVKNYEFPGVPLGYSLKPTYGNTLD